MIDVKCNWGKCAHGTSIASSDGEGCYMQSQGGDPDNSECECFITDKAYEEKGY